MINSLSCVLYDLLGVPFGEFSHSYTDKTVGIKMESEDIKSFGNVIHHSSEGDKGVSIFDAVSYLSDILL